MPTLFIRHLSTYLERTGTPPQTSHLSNRMSQVDVTYDVTQ